MKNFAILDLILPRACAVCGRTLLMNERYLCPECFADLPRTHFSKMRRNQMADRFNDLVQRSSDSGCQGYLYATALFSIVLLPAIAILPAALNIIQILV